MIDTAVTMEIIDKSGTWLSYGEVKLGQGREAAKTFLKDNANVYAQIEKKVKEKAGLIPTAALPAAPAVSGTSPSPTRTLPSETAPKAALAPPVAPMATTAPPSGTSPAGSKEKVEAKVEVKKETAFVPTEKAKLALKK